MTEKEVTRDYLCGEEDYVRLFLFLNDKKEINQEILLKDFFKQRKAKGKDTAYPIRWNYSEDPEKKYPCNETRHLLLNALKKSNISPVIIDNFLGRT